jgi:exodeoxyribonuclease-3
MKLISWNINGIRAAWRKGLLDFVTAEQPDILCVQETKIQLEQLTPELKDVGGYHSYWSMAEKKGYSGVATMRPGRRPSRRVRLGRAL